MTKIILSLPLIINFVLWTIHCFVWQTKHIQFCEQYGFDYDGSEFWTSWGHLIGVAMFLITAPLFFYARI